jgi:opacity protein-like surface antigen
MKKFALTLFAAAAATLSTGAMAQIYVSGDIGQGHSSIDCTGTDSCSKNDTAFKVTGGYKFGQGFSAELGYIDFGKLSFTDTSTGTAVAGDIATHGITLGGLYELRLAPQIDGTARLGIASVETKVSGAVAGVGSASQSETNTQLYYGLGLNYAVARNVKLEGGIDWSHGKFQGSSFVVRAITVGGRYEF